MKKVIRTSLFLLFLSLAQCAEIFVRSGTTGGNGTSASPFGSIQEALNIASSNDIITLYNGTYTGTPNTFLSLGSLTSITIQGYDNDPAKAVIQWMGASTVSFLNMSSNAPTVKLQGLGFTGRILADNSSWGYTAPTFYVASGSLDINNCRFENFTTNSFDATEVLYVFVTKGATATIRNSNFIRGTGCFGIQLEQGNVSVSTSNFVSHTIVNPGGNCLSIKASATNAYFTITNNNFVSSSTPLYFPKGNITMTGNGFYNCSSVVLCNPLQSTIITSGNKFCGSSTGSCSSVSVANIRPFDGCGICDGTNVNKDCNGVCWGTSRGSSCTTRKTIWVSSTGTGDGTARNKTASISTAITQANFGDTIILLTGTYSGGINTAGKKGLTIRSENGIPDYDNVTINCQTGTKNAFTFSNGESFDTVIQGITITNCGDNFGATPVYIGANTGVTFQSVNFYKNGDLGTYGGAIFLLDGFIRTIDVTFQNNSGSQGSVVNGHTSNNLTKATYFSATNARFLNNYADDRGAIFFDGGLIEITNSYFSQNDALSGSAAIYTYNTTYLRLVNNSFSNTGVTGGAPKAFTCSLRNDSTQSLNTFCGSSSTISYSIGCASYFGSLSLSGSPDTCGVCNGNNVNRDCSGTCFGKQTNNTKGCCFTPSRDCDGTCFGSYLLDVNSTCCDKIAIDACNICGGNNSCLCDLNYNPFAPVCRNNGTCTPAPAIVLYGSYCNCSLSGGYFGFNCTDFNCTSPCETRGNCTGPDYCTCNTSLWEGAKTGCNTPVCKGDQNCEDRGNCTSPGFCTCNATLWTGSTTGCHTPVCSGAQDCGSRGNCTSPGLCACNTTLWTGSTTGCNTPVCSGAQDCGSRGTCILPGECACNTTAWTGSFTGCHTPVCSGAQDCGGRGTCIAPGECACNTTDWTGSFTGCNTPVCSGSQDCGARGACAAPGQCACNTTDWTGSFTGCNTPVCSGAQDCESRGNCTSPGFCACNTTLWTGSSSGCHTPVCSDAQDCGSRGTCISPGECSCNTIDWTGSFTGCNTPVCSGSQDCGARGACVAPGECSCNTIDWTGSSTGCNTPVCSYGSPICNGGDCVAPGVCNCDGVNQTSTCVSVSPSVTPSTTPSRTPSASASPSSSASPSPTSSPSATASPSTGASSSPTSSPATSPESSPAASSTSFPSPTATPSPSQDITSASGTEKGKDSPVDGPVLYAVVVIGVVAFLVLLASLVVFVWRRRRSDAGFDNQLELESPSQ